MVVMRIKIDGVHPKSIYMYRAELDVLITVFIISITVKADYNIIYL